MLQKEKSTFTIKVVAKRNRKEGKMYISFSENEFNSLLAKYGLTRRKFCLAMHFTMPTLKRKVDNQGDFTRAEIVRMISLFSKEEVIKLFFGNEVA